MPQQIPLPPKKHVCMGYNLSALCALFFSLDIFIVNEKITFILIVSNKKMNIIYLFASKPHQQTARDKTIILAHDSGYDHAERPHQSAKRRIGGKFRNPC
jgi:hypothetical protein